MRLVWRSVRTADGADAVPLHPARAACGRGARCPISPLDAVATLAAGRGRARRRSRSWSAGSRPWWWRVRARGSWLRRLSAVPLGVSAVTVGFGYVVAFDARVLDLRGSLAAAWPPRPWSRCRSSWRLVEPVLSRPAWNCVEQAAALGASPWQAARDVVLPVASRAFLGAAAFAFADCAGGVRCDRVRRPARLADDAGRRSRACSRSRGRQPWSGDRDERGADGGDGRDRRSRSTASGSARGSAGSERTVRPNGDRVRGAVGTCTTEGSSEALRRVSSVPAGTSTAFH